MRAATLVAARMLAIGTALDVAAGVGSSGSWRAIELPARSDSAEHELAVELTADHAALTDKLGRTDVLTEHAYVAGPPGTAHAVLSVNTSIGEMRQFLLVKDQGWESLVVPMINNATLGLGGGCRCSAGSKGKCAGAIGACVAACAGSGGWACSSSHLQQLVEQLAGRFLCAVHGNPAVSLRRTSALLRRAAGT